MSKTHAEESLGANPGDAALNPADSVAMGVPASKAPRRELFFGAGTFRALHHRPFRLLFAAFMINQIGFWVSHITLQAFMVDLSDNDTRLNGWLFFMLFVPAFLLAPVAGVAADRFDRKRIVLCCYGLITIACFGLAYFTFSDQMTPALLLCISLGMGFSFAFSGPASHAIAANSVPTEDLASAVSLQSAANNLTRVAGPLLAAPLVATGRYEWSFCIYLVAAGIAAGLTMAMQIRGFEPDQEDIGIFSRMAGGFHHARERQPALPALSIVAVLSFFGVSHAVLIPAYAQNVLGGKEWFVWIITATGTGAMIGALRAGRTAAVPGIRSAALLLVVYGVGLALFAITTSPTLALATQVVVGYCYFAVMTNLQTLIQQLVDESKRGRVMSLFQICWAGLVPFGSLAMGFLAEPIGVPLTLLIAGTVCVGYGAAMSFRRDAVPIPRPVST